ncbi:rod shape-determining protein MreC [Allosphingosinicella deserti]|uniref:Cell shape-determining protein MreC n=1 Tax=Allosphingosinicella deserti TaxID=2116704 RepID=A0A2P7QHH2_9SPHN|nr:rod shape-determining protein MreC [Sphingomonas deserti]PSJ37409.1 rod shape-determining protein MreC [Sphingomonas deserti]
MAPPSTRRPGFSRRAQYGLFLGYVVAVAGVLFALMLLTLSVIDPRGFGALKGAALDATSPVSSAGRGIVNFFGGIGSTVGNYFNAGAQNDDLKRQLAATRRKIVEARATELENQRLKAMLKLSETVGDEVTVTRVVGSSFDSSRRLATLSVGSGAGVAPGQPVRSPEGLIGRVIETGRWASRVLLVSDGASSVPVRLVRDGTPAIAQGLGDGSIDLKTLEVGKNPFRRGDILVTSGVGGVYPPNVPVAVVVRVERERTTARPLADPATVDFAMVLRPFQPVADQPLSQATSEALQGAAQ